MAPSRLLLAAALLLPVPVLAEQLLCNGESPAPACQDRCAALLAWLRMRFGHEHFQQAYQEESEAMGLWHVCPHAKAGLVLSQAAFALRPRNLGGLGVGLEEARALLSKALLVFEALVLRQSVNLTRYLQPQVLSFAPFFHLARLGEALRSRPELLPESVEGWALGEGLEAQLRALGDYLATEEVPPRPEFRQRLRLPEEGRLRCSLKTATLLYAQADLLRLELDWPWTKEGAGRFARLLARAGSCLQRSLRDALPMSFLRFVAKSGLPLFEVLDRLDGDVVLPLLLDAQPWRGRPFQLHVLPGSNIEANLARSMLALHCDMAFKELLAERREQSPPGPFVIVEVGAHLGGCIFHALTSHNDVQALAVEPYQPAAAAMRRTAANNGLGSRFKVLSAFASDEAEGLYTVDLHASGMAPWLHQPIWTASGETGGAVRTARLDALLREANVWVVDLLRIHVLGRELSALRSVEALLRAGMVKALAIAVFNPAPQGREGEALQMARLLHGLGFSLRYAGASGAAAEALLASPARPPDTSTLLATLEA